MSTSSKSLGLKKVGVTLGKQTILKDIELKLNGETIYTVLGPSGTGKSTLLKLLAGLIPLSEGEIEYAGEAYQPATQVIGVVPQNYGLLPWQTAWQAVTSAFKISGKQKKISQVELDKLNHLFSVMNIEELKNKFPHEMSGGQQQRVSITRAFAVKGDFLLMDEPFSALDAFTRETVQQLFLDTWYEEPKLTLFITHDIDEAVLLGHKIVLMAEQPGTIVKVIDNPLRQQKLTLAEIRETDEFYALVRELRKELQTSGS